MPFAHNGSYSINYDVLGPRDGQPVLMVMGLGAQMIAWREEFCALIVDHGYQVIRFDNRDIGLSTYTQATPPTVGELVRRAIQLPRQPEPIYTLSDMAADGMAVLDDLGIESAHVVGASMGGMIAQTMCIEHPTRTRSLTSIMSTTGSRRVGHPTPKAVKLLLEPSPDERTANIEYSVKTFEYLWADLYEPDAMRDYFAQAYDRARSPHGAAFQLAAVLAGKDRTNALGALDLPALVIHGRKDPLVRIGGGMATAAAIPGAQMVIYNGMGHGLPRPLWGDMTHQIVSHLNRAEAASMARSDALLAQTAS
ncbi:MAG TPA: alpha/beta hydrolase [Acidimicrobiaceae bacterium]|jgi:pimeloyl-ACP methyl ester carboxylesterase|nr:alpha/beta hydrolase [Acidimicrobiaceae bacterium]